jgi:hypothetical protein
MWALPTFVKTSVGRREDCNRGNTSALGEESKRQMPLLRIKRIMINGIWLFAGEGALFQRESLPPMQGT